jgi:glucose/arabinose dehydrogenase
VRRLVLAAVATLIAAGCSHAGAGDGLVDIGAGLRGRKGLSAATFATGVPKVSALAFDDEGQLWAASADFADTGADGVYVVSAEGAAPAKVIADLHTPLGLAWWEGELYVASKERVDAYAGFDGTAFAGQRTVVTFPAGVGEVNGIVAGGDGRLHLGISAPCDNCTPTVELSGSVVSFLPDGSDLRVDVRSIRAPIGLAYAPGTDDLYVTMNQRDDLAEATPGDWLAVVQSGQDWGFPDCHGQAGSACADAPTPAAVLDKHAAAAGVAFVDATTAIVAEWATGKVLTVDIGTGAVTTLVTGVANPVPVVATEGGVLVGDWKTGTISRVTGGMASSSR